MNKLNIYVVDDDEAVRDSLSILLRSAGYDVKSFASGLDFLRAAANLEPGCLIVDVRMPEIDGLELQKRLNEMKLSFAVIVITGHGDVAMAVRAMKVGAVDFVEKPFSREMILGSVELGASQLKRTRTQDQGTAVASERLALLTPRERQVLDGLMAGFPNKTIGFDLGISPRTVEIHRARVIEKLQARSFSELIRIALAAGVEIKS